MRITSLEEDLEVREEGIYDKCGKIVVERRKIEKAYIQLVNKDITPLGEVSYVDVTRISPPNPKKYPIIESIPNSIRKEKGLDLFYIEVDCEILHDELLREALVDYMGVESYDVVKKIAKENIIGADMKKDEDEVIFQNFLTGKSVSISKEVLRDSILKAYGDETSSCSYIGKIEDRFHYVSVEFIESNYCTLCILCDRKRDNCEYLKIFEKPPFCVCEHCLDEFMRKYLDSSVGEIVSNAI